MWKAESFGVSDPGQARWVNSMATPESLRTFEESLSLNQTSIVLSSYIFCSGEPTGVFYRPFVERAINRGWNSAELPKAHFPMVTMPETLADLLIEVGEARD